MNTLKLLTMILGISFACSLGCGSNGSSKGGTGGTIIGPLGTGGAGQGGSTSSDASADAPISSPDLPAVGPGLDTAPREAGSATPFVDCTGLTKEQCHDLIINPPTLHDGVLPLDPGASPAIPYPNCTAT